jgi:hypothetical protein
MRTKRHELEGLGGWLVLVFFGLFVSLLRIPATLMTTHVRLLLDGTISNLIDPQSAAYHPLWLPLILFEVAGNLFILALVVATLVLLFARSRYAPAIAIALYASNVGVILGDILACQLIPALAEQPMDKESLMDLGRALFAALIWIPYFLVSQRVRVTFTRYWPALPGRKAPAVIPPLPPVAPEAAP